MATVDSGYVEEDGIAQCKKAVEESRLQGGKLKFLKRLSTTKILVAIVIAVIAANAGYYWLRSIYRPVEVRLCEGITRRSLLVPGSYSRTELSRSEMEGKSFKLTIKFDAANPTGAPSGGLATCEFNGENDAVYALPVITRVQINGEDILGLAILDDVIRRRVASSWY